MGEFLFHSVQRVWNDEEIRHWPMSKEIRIVRPITEKTATWLSNDSAVSTLNPGPRQEHIQTPHPISTGLCFISIKWPLHVGTPPGAHKVNQLLCTVVKQIKFRGKTRGVIISFSVNQGAI